MEVFLGETFYDKVSFVTPNNPSGTVVQADLEYATTIIKDEQTVSVGMSASWASWVHIGQFYLIKFNQADPSFPGVGNYIVNIDQYGSLPTDLWYPLTSDEPIIVRANAANVAKWAGTNVALLNDKPSVNSASADAAAAGIATLISNMRMIAIAPKVMERPASGGYYFYLHLYCYGADGKPEDLDALPSVAATNLDLEDRSSNLGVVSQYGGVGSGHYVVDYWIDYQSVIEPVEFTWTVVEDGVSRQIKSVMQITNMTADMLGSDGRVLISRDAQNLSGTLQVNANVPSAASVADAVWNEPAADHTDAATFGKTVNIIASCLSGITSLAAWLRAIVRKDAADAMAKTGINAGGGEYDETTDSLQAIRDRTDGLKVPVTNESHIQINKDES